MALPAIPTATPPITVTKSDGTTISVPTPVTAPLTNGVKFVGAREVVQAETLDTNFVQILENFASTTAPTTPVVGQIWYDTNAPAQLKVYTGLAAPDDWQSISSASGNIVDPANTTVAASSTGTLGGGSGTSASPYIITDTVGAGQTKLVATVTVTGLVAGQFVAITDLNAATNDSRFSFSNYFADASGVLIFTVILTDIPASATGTSYTCALKVGAASVYIDITVSVVAAFPLSTGVNYPSGLGQSTTAWTVASDVLTPTGCIDISVDGINWISNPSTLSINNGDTLYTRWRGSAGSGVCIDSANGTVLTGGVTASNGASANTATLTVDKTPNSLTFADRVAQGLGTVTSTFAVTVSGVNSYIYVTGSVVNGTNLEASVNGGAWASVPASGTSLVMTSGQQLQTRLTNSSSPGVTSTATLSVGTLTGLTWTSTTVSGTATVATPSVTAPVNNATGIATLPTFASDPMISGGSAGSHYSSDWQVASDALFASIVASTTNDTANLQSWTLLTPLSYSTDYYVRVRYTSNPTTVTSAYSSGIKFTTKARLGINWTLGGISALSAEDAINNSACVGLANRTSVGGLNGQISTLVSGSWWTTNLSTTSWGTQKVYGVRYTGNQFIAIGGNGYTATSPDGQIWSNIITGGIGSLNTAISGVDADASVANGTTIVVGGRAGRFALSTDDGATWTSTSTFTWGMSPDTTAACWTGSAYIMISNQADCATSADGATWSTASSTNFRTAVGSVQPMYGLAAGGGKVVAVGANGVIVVSSDNGATWAASTSGTASTLNTVTWDGTQFVAGGANGLILLSFDGVTWTTSATTPMTGTWNTVGGPVTAVISDGSQLLAFGQAGNWATSP